MACFVLNQWGKMVKSEQLEVGVFKANSLKAIANATERLVGALHFWQPNPPQWTYPEIGALGKIHSPFLC